MTVRTPAELKTNMPQGIVNAIDVLDIHDIVDTLEDRTTQDIVPKTANYTGVTATDNRHKIVFNAAGAVTFTVPSDAPAGWECAVIQQGSGAVTIAVGGTGALFSRSSHTKTAGQYAIAYVVVVSNAGTAPQVYLGGDTAV